MTLKVYKVDRQGSVRVLQPEAEVIPIKVAETSSTFPACQCPRCKRRPS